MRSRLILATVPLALVGLAVAPSVAAPKAKPKPKPITATYQASALPGATCDGTVPTALHATKVKLPAAGTLKVVLNGFQGDWDLALLNGASELGSSAALNPVDATDEQVAVRIKRPTTITIDACNFVGGPTATVTYVFTYA